ncbi:MULTISPECIES: ESX secretion-associated protein EspG [Nocardia]|uniref:ESX secretion-associated protein EspG n=1 Tax=Nocardia TaxID=1817 RepID=UPI000D68C8F6|nr:MULTISPECIES: ESX secretion-associated protein EspG [Nocardia]
MRPREWVFSPLAFKVLWRAADRDVLPYPLQYRSTFETVAEHDEAWKSEARGLHRILDEELYGALRVLAEPEARVEVAGAVNGDRLRVHAALHYQHAVLLEQEPTGSPYRGGTVRMTMFDAHRLSHRIVTLLPNAPRGRGPGLEISRFDLEAEDGGVYRLDHDGAARSSLVRAKRFFERPRDLVVHVAAYAGPAWDNRPAPSRGFHVMDYPDGRYLVRNGTTLQAVPVDRMGLQIDLERVVRFTVTSHREEHDPSYR